MKGASKYIVAVLVIAAAVIGGYWLITKQPGVHIGELNLVSEENEMINLLGYEAVNYYKGSSEDVPLPEFNELLNVMPEINQKNLVLGGQALTTYSGIEIQASSNYELEITGLGPYVGDITYSFYNLDGTAISLEQTDFGIPAGTYREQSEACVVEISVKWGRVENYRLYKYYLKCNF